MSTAPGAGRLAVIGIGEDGWDGLSGTARGLLERAERVIGSERQLGLLPPAAVTAEREIWPSPMGPRLDELAAALTTAPPPASWVVLGSGDPMLHGVGSSLTDRGVPADRLWVLPAPSAFALACARLGWPQHRASLVSHVHMPAPLAGEVLRVTGKLVVYVPGAGGAAALADDLVADGLADVRFVVMERLGGPLERIVDTTAGAWRGDADPLHLVALERPTAEEENDPSRGHPAEAEGDARLASRVPGLPDDRYGGDGQLTRAEIRAVVLAALAPARMETLWDVGAGSGTVAIEWCRATPGARAFAVEQRADRVATIEANAARLGAPRVETVTGAAPAALTGLPAPDAIFVGGGAGEGDLLERCHAALAPGGRLVATAVTLEGERALIDAQARWGGRLVRLEHATAEPIGRFLGWQPQRPIVLWSLAVSGSEA